MAVRLIFFPTEVKSICRLVIDCPGEVDDDPTIPATGIQCWVQERRQMPWMRCSVANEYVGCGGPWVTLFSGVSIGRGSMLFNFIKKSSKVAATKVSRLAIKCCRSACLSSFSCWPSFGGPQQIDLLLGAEVFVNILHQALWKGPAISPAAIETEFGWVFDGNTVSSSDSPVVSPHAWSVYSDDLLHEFFEIEESLTDPPALTQEEC